MRGISRSSWKYQSFSDMLKGLFKHSSPVERKAKVDTLFLEIVIIKSQIYFVMQGYEKNGAFTPVGEIVIGPTLEQDVLEIGNDLLRVLTPVRTLSAAENADIGAFARACQAIGFRDDDAFLRKAKMVFAQEVEGDFSFIPTKRWRGGNFEFMKKLPVDSKEPAELGKKLLEAVSQCV